MKNEEEKSQAQKEYEEYLRTGIAHLSEKDKDMDFSKVDRPKDYYDEIYTEAFGGLTLFYRDTNLADNLISKYKVGQIIMERAFTDMSYKGGGLHSNFRYLIASANGKDVSAISENAFNWGLIILQKDAYFKVLDIYTLEGKTQVLLLNIPERGIELFKSATSNVEENIIEKARQSFKDKINLPVLEELTTKEWKARTEFPLGMNDNGEMFYPDETQ